MNTEKTAAHVYAQLPSNWKLAIVHADFGSAIQNFLSRKFGLRLDPVKKLEAMQKTVKKVGPVVMQFPLEKAYVLNESPVGKQEIYSAIIYLNSHANEYFNSFFQNVEVKRNNNLVEVVFS